MYAGGVAGAPDAVVIGSGPNGLAAAIVLARAGLSVTVFEAEGTIGGGVRSAELTLPGFVHDVCSAIHPFAVLSPFFRTLPLGEHGLEWIEPPAPLAHPLDGGRAVLVERSVGRTAESLGADGRAYRRLMDPLRHPLALPLVGLRALRPASRVFRGEAARAVFAGLAAHGMLPLEHALTGGFGLALGISAHATGWPLPRGGAQRIANALASYLRSLGGEIVTGRRVRTLEELPPARAILCDLTPRPLLQIAGGRFPPRYRRKLLRYRYGVGAYKVDWALDGPIPWAAPECARAATVHLGGTFDEIARSERDCWEGRHAERPFVLLAQPALFDGTRAPVGKQTVWGYCHVPHGSEFDMLGRIEGQIERFAPGFGERVLARSVMTPAAIERHNANLVGGDIAGGVNDLRQFFWRPTWRWYSTPVRGLYICSQATPPGVGVHGMCGYFAARRALAEVFGIR